MTTKFESQIYKFFLLKLSKMDILSKAEPKSLKQFVGNKAQVKAFIEAITLTKEPIALVGPSGCGKTSLMRLLLSHLGYQSFLEITKDIACKDMIASIKNYAANRSVMTYFAEKKPKSLVFIDDYDILCTTEKSVSSGLRDLLPFLEKNQCKLVLTSLGGYQNEKKLQELKKSVVIVQMTYPTPKDAFVHLINYVEGKEDRVLEMLNKYKGNIRDAILHLDAPDDTFVSLCFKDLSTFDIVRKIFNNKKTTTHEMGYIFRDDPCTVAYTLYENLPEEIAKRNLPILDEYMWYVKQYSEISEIDTYAFDNMNWKMLDIANMLRLESIRVRLNDTVVNTKPGASSTFGPPFRPTQLLSKISHKNIYRKKLQTIGARSKLTQDEVRGLIDTAKGAITSYQADDGQCLTVYKKYFSPQYK